MQLPKLLKASLSDFHVIQTFCYADKMDPTHSNQSMQQEFQKPDDNELSETAAGQWLCRQLTSFYCPTTQWADLPSLDLPTILTQIRSMHAVPAESSLVIFFQIDEFQQRLANCSHLLRYLGSLIRATRPKSPLKTTNTLIVPVLTGTWIGDLMLATEMIDLKLLLVGLDSPEDAHSLFTDYLKSSNLEQSKLIPAFEAAYHRHTLTMLAYIPKIIVTYASVFQANPSDLSNRYAYEKMWKILQHAVAISYNPSNLTQVHKDHVLSLWYFATPVGPLYDLGDGLTIQSLMNHGVLFLNQQKECYTVAVPLVIARIWKEAFFDLDSFIDPWAQLTETGFPRFILTIHQLTYRMMGLQADLSAKFGDQAAFKRSKRSTNQEQPEVLTSVSEIYNYAIEGSKAILDRPLWIQPNVELLPKEGFDPSVYGLCESPDRAAGADAVTPHAAEQYKSFMAFAKAGAVTSGASLNGTTVVAELNKDFYDRELLAIITPKTISGVELVQDQFYRIKHGPKGLHATRSFPRPADAPLLLGPIDVKKRVRGSSSTTSFTDRLLILHTEAKLKLFTRGLMSFASEEAMASVSKSIAIKRDGDASEVWASPPNRRSTRIHAKMAQGRIEAEQLEEAPNKTTTTTKKKKEEEEIEPEPAIEIGEGQKMEEKPVKKKKRSAPTQASDDEDGEFAYKKSKPSADDE